MNDSLKGRIIQSVPPLSWKFSSYPPREENFVPHDDYGIPPLIFRAVFSMFFKYTPMTFSSYPLE